MMRRLNLAALFAASALSGAMACGTAFAADAGDADAAVASAGAAKDVEEVVVFGRGEAKIGVAHAASEGTVGGADLLVRPLLRTAELLEAVPGMIAAQHSGSGKANQYFLRGFNLDHGSDFTTYIDDVQMNFRTHGHGQGYLDLNGADPGDRRAGGLPQGPLPRRRRRLRARGRGLHDHQGRLRPAVDRGGGWLVGTWTPGQRRHAERRGRRAADPGGRGQGL